METLQNKEEVEIKMSRNERRSRIRHFLKLFNEHVEKKPVINVEEIDEEKQKLKVNIEMFGRETSTELDFDQIDKID